MSQVKIDIANKSIADKLKKSKTVLTNLGTPGPADLASEITDLAAKQAALDTAAQAAATAEQNSVAKHTAQDTAEADFEQSYSALARAAQTSAKGDKTILSGWGFDIRADATRHSSIGAMENFHITGTNSTGALDFAWEPIANRVSYEIQYRKATDPVDQYRTLISTTRTRYRGNAFESGVEYVFRARVHGSGELVSDWSDEATKRAS